LSLNSTTIRITYQKTKPEQITPFNPFQGMTYLVIHQEKYGEYIPRGKGILDGHQNND